jgi:ectoine hydroxylase-related dioxygenase (phytanoyl-CoA dioxygenase family)
MHLEYESNGYFVVKQLYNSNELQVVKQVLESFHESWLKDNLEFYKQSAINSAFLTSTKYLTKSQRQILFNFIGSSKLMNVVKSVLGGSAAFMNTQLFFNPHNIEQKNYWHRDTQYDLSIEQQKKALSGSKVLHFRVAIKDEPGLELVPKSHKEWDTQEEIDIRLESNNHKNHENLTTAKKVSLNTGDCLIFSANMIHRGLYGKNRMAFDILFFESDISIAKHINNDCLPNKSEMKIIENTQAFVNSIQLKA